MKKLINSIFIVVFTIILSSLSNSVNAQAKAQEPVLLTSCGQSTGTNNLKVYLKPYSYIYEALATAKTLVDAQKSGKPFKSVIISTGASLKGMGAAGSSIDVEIERTKALIAEAKKQKITIIGAHVGGMKNRSQGENSEDTTDEQSIDAVCPFSNFLFVKKEGNSDGRFTKISKDKKITMLEFEKNSDLGVKLNELFGKK